MQVSQNVKLEQSQILTPQMRQSLNVLQANSIQLRQIANANLCKNPLLEEVKDDSNTISLEANSSDIESENFDAEPSQKDKFLESIAQGESFQEHLRNQAALEISSPKVLKAFNALADLLDSRGFLPQDAFAECKEFGITQEDLNAALKVMQNCHPAGIGARDIRESFLIQLRQSSRENSLAYTILDSHYELLQKRNFQEISRLVGVSVDEIQNAISEIAALDMSPAKTFSDDILYINPDVIFFKKDGKWQCELTNEGVPNLRVNNTYRNMIAQGALSADDAKFIKDKIRDAKDFIEALENRQTSLEKLAQLILQKQKDFFEKGEGSLRALTMQQAAEILGVHPATVSRTVSEKYARLGNKILPLKYFFPLGVKQDGADTLSNAAIKEEIAKIIASENPQKPYSDAQLAEILKSKNIDIARRTVAKYREELNIPSKQNRRA